MPAHMRIQEEKMSMFTKEKSECSMEHNFTAASRII
jgi:hypothetical protein